MNTPEAKAWTPPTQRHKTDQRQITTVNDKKARHTGEQATPNTADGQHKPLKALTRKQRAFVEHIANNPKDSATEAVAQTYDVKTRHTAEQIAHENMRKPEIMAELSKYLSKAEYNLMVLADKTTEYALLGGKDGASYAGVSERVNNSIIDRLKGKAIVRQQIETRAVTLNIDLTGVANADHTRIQGEQQG